MGKRGECSYNPQLGYLKTIFAPEYDFITQVLSYEFRDSRLWLHTATLVTATLPEFVIL